MDAARSGPLRPRFSVLIVNFNGGEWVARAVESVLAQEGPTAEVLVADNASTDGSAEALARFAGREGSVAVRVLPMGENLGFAVANNRAFAASTGEIILLLNPDALLSPGVLQILDEAARRHPEAGSFACSVRFVDRPDVLNSTGLILFADGTAMDRDFGVAVAQSAAPAGPVLGPMGGAALWKREVVERLGFFCEDFFLYYEDVDLALRAQRAGFACIYVPDAIVLHKWGMAVERTPRAWVRELQYSNAARTLARNFGPFLRWRGLLIFVARAALSLLRGDRPQASARFKAIVALLRERRALALQRASIRPLGPEARVAVWAGLGSGKR